MAKNFTHANVDFDSLFDPDVMGDGPSASWLTSGGIALKYAALKYGTKGADVGFVNNANSDVSNLWAAKGTAVYQTVSFVGGLGVVVPNGWVGLANQAYRFTLNADGTGSKARGPTLAALAFDWTSDGNPPLKDYEVRLSAVVIDEANGAWAFTNNTGGAWVALDDAHGATVVTLVFVPNSNSGQGNFAANGLLEVREKLTGVVVHSANMSITGTAANA